MGDSEGGELDYLHKLVNDLGAVVWEFDWSSGAFTFVSEAAEDLLGYSVDEWLEPGFWVDHLHPDDADAAQQLCVSATEQGLDHDFEYRMLHSNGDVVWVRDIVSVDPVKRLAGALRGLIVDITPRKFAEAAQKASEERHRSIFDGVGMMAAMVDLAGRITYVNQASCDLVGLSADDLVGQRYLKMIPAASRRELRREHGRRLADRAIAEPMQVPIKTSSGETRILSLSGTVLRDDDGKPVGAALAGTDVTERATEQLQIGRHAEEFDAIFRLTRDLFFRLDANGAVTDYRAATDDVLYVPPEIFVGKAMEDFLPPEQAEILDRSVSEAHASGTMTIAEYELPSGEEMRDWEARFLPLDDGDTVLVCRDITERKRQEEALELSRENYRVLVEMSPYSICVVGIDGVIHFVNNAAVWAFGAASPSDIEGRRASDFIPPDRSDDPSFDIVRRMHADLTERGWRAVAPEAAIQMPLLTLEGRTIETECSVAAVSYQGQPALLTMLRDITRELAIQKEVLQSRDFLSHLLEMLDCGVIVVEGRDPHIVRVNSPTERLLGYERGELLGASTRVLHDSDDAWQRVKQHTVELLTSGGSFQSEVTLQRKDGTVFQAETTVRGIDSDSGTRLGIIRDISDRKAAEQLLKESEQRFRSIVEEAPFGMHLYELTESGSLVLTGSNDAADQMLGLRHADLIGMDIYDAFPGADEAEFPTAYRRLAKQGGTWHMEVPYADDNIKGVYEVTAFQTSPGRIAVTFTDITERKAIAQSEKDYQRRLSAMAAEVTAAEDRERRRLAEELHDRVGQALAVSRMHLQAAKADGQHYDENELRLAMTMLEDAIRETRAVTTELYPPLLHELGLGPALRWLADEIHGKHGLECKVAVCDEAVEVGDDAQAVLFRSARELLMNVVKHAGTDTAWLSMDVLDDALVLTVADQGHGFDMTEAHGPTGDSGFGLFSIRERFPHLGGSVDVESASGHGTKVTLRVPRAS